MVDWEIVVGPLAALPVWVTALSWQVAVPTGGSGGRGHRGWRKAGQAPCGPRDKANGKKRLE